MIKIRLIISCRLFVLHFILNYVVDLIKRLLDFYTHPAIHVDRILEFYDAIGIWEKNIAHGNFCPYYCKKTIKNNSDA